MSGLSTKKFRFPRHLPFRMAMVMAPVWLALPVSLNAQDSLKTEPTGAIQRMIIPPDTGQTLSENDLISNTLKKSRKLNSLSAEAEIARHIADGSGFMPNPELRISNLTNRYYQEKWDELRVGLRIRLPELGEMSEDKEKARLDFWELKVEEDRYRQELIMRLRQDIADVVAYDRMAELAEKKRDLLDRRIGMIEQMLKTGERSVVYYTKAKMMREEARNDFARSVQNQASARRKLAARADIGLDTPIQTGDPLEVPGDLDGLIAFANQHRPETGLVRQQIELAVKQRRMERLKLLPWFNFLEFSYHREQTRAEDWAELNMGIELPLFDWNIGNIRATNLAVKKGEARYGAVLESVDEDVRSAYMLYRDLLLDWKNFKISAETHIRDAENVVSQATVYETLRPDEVLEMELTQIDTHRLLAEKRRDLAYALSDLLFVLGVERMEQLSETGENAD